MLVALEWHFSGALVIQWVLVVVAWLACEIYIVDDLGRHPYRHTYPLKIRELESLLSGMLCVLTAISSVIG